PGARARRHGDGEPRGGGAQRGGGGLPSRRAARIPRSSLVPRGGGARRDRRRRGRRRRGPLDREGRRALAAPGIQRVRHGRGMALAERRRRGRAPRVRGSAPVSRTDVLILGSGIAGLMTALKVAAATRSRVQVLTKKSAEDSNTNWAQGG